MSFLTLSGLAKAFGSFHAVENLSLEVERGEFLSLLGPSGCGKTTTLQMIAGFVEPTRGRIVLHGRDITALRPEKRGMGVVFQSYALFPHMTVAGNIGFGLEMRGVTAAERGRRIDEALELVRLGGLGQRYPKELSGGQRQRVAIARALAIRPEVLLLDEPMSNLDAKLREDMHIELRAIQRQLGITTILVTHDQVEAMTMSDRIAVMHGGRIVQLATPFEAYERPQSAFASGFLGKTNSLAGVVEKTNARCCEVRLGDTLAHVQHEGRQVGREVQVYVRPEKIRLGRSGDGGIPGTVHTRLFLGNHWMLEIDSALGRLRVSQPNLGETPPAEGAAVSVLWHDQDLRVLASETATEARHA
ncbi:ABC transporter ATP-binding protein [Cupriavidus taiwanensis]|uniref:ABC transporter ATP-binding protein n=1 Tax=Cupriavidus taiwanensis TaxID=164546 RepID=UPI000E158433|nr:ABC transporter ATP-binding protein [Cupriavidus taiwanensis]SPC15390.1 polyamine transporter subunit; ATP-binding component of ABC superfamily [Cupriavidus taiwanensis]